MLIVEKLFVFFLLMLTGLVLMKTGVLDENACKKLSAIVINVANPALILRSALSADKVPPSELLVTAVIAVALFTVLLGVGALLPRLLRVKGQVADAYSLMIIFSNIGFMGLPLISAIFGDSALLYATVFFVPYNLLIYTYGERLIHHPDGKGGRLTASLKKALNPGVIACVAAVTIYLTGVRVPDVIASPVEYLSNLTAPLSMMVIGASLAGVKVKEFFTDGRMLAFSAVKMLALPIALCLLLRLVIGNGVLLGVCVVMTAAPVGSMTAMMAQEFGGEYRLISKGVALTTILSVVTIPIVFAVMGM
jgi:malate permease and related proteins